MIISQVSYRTNGPLVTVALNGNKFQYIATIGMLTMYDVS